MVPAERRVRLAVTLGDPRGIGAEIVSTAVQDAAVAAACDTLVVGPAGLAVAPAMAVGHWSPAMSVADAGRLACAAIERAVSMALAGEIGRAHV